MLLTAILAVALAAPTPSVPAVHGPRRTTDRTPTYRFASHERGLPSARIRFRCAFDRARLRRCRARHTQRLALGRHLLRVQAVDPAARRSRVRRVVVEAVAPSAWRIRRIEVGGHPFSLAEAGGAIWVANFQSGQVQRIDPAANAVVARLPAARGAQGFAFDAPGLWVANYDDGRLRLLDPGSGKALERWQLDGGARDVLVAAGSVWVANSTATTVTRLTPR